MASLDRIQYDCSSDAVLTIRDPSGSCDAVVARAAAFARDHDVSFEAGLAATRAGIMKGTFDEILPIDSRTGSEFFEPI